jgi:hypothetical protein
MTATLPLHLRDELLMMIKSPGLKDTEVRHPSLRTDIPIIRLACDIAPLPAGGITAYDHYGKALGEICARVVQTVFNHVSSGEHPKTNVLIFVTQKGDITFVKTALWNLLRDSINIGVYHSGSTGDCTADDVTNDEAERRQAIAFLRSVPRSDEKIMNVIICTTAFFVGVDEEIHVAISLGPLSDVVDTSQAMGRLNRREKSRKDVGAFIVLHSTQHSNYKYIVNYSRYYTAWCYGICVRCGRRIATCLL